MSKITVTCGGQWGSEGKGAIAAWLAHDSVESGNPITMATTNAGAQAGHTTVVKPKLQEMYGTKGSEFVCFHLPSSAVLLTIPAYLNAGSIIDIKRLMDEIEATGFPKKLLSIHPNAAVITDDDKLEEGQINSSNTSIASTRKGVGAALANKIRRKNPLAKHHPELEEFIRVIDLNEYIGPTKFSTRGAENRHLMVEIPQGLDLSLNASGFYPHTTSRDCWVGSGLHDACIHPSIVSSVDFRTVMVCRSFPIRVGNIVEDGKTLGTSGGAYPHQREREFEELGIDPEYTTVTKRKRRIFDFSVEQMVRSLRVNRPTDVVFSFMNYFKGYSDFNVFIQKVREADGHVGNQNVTYWWQYGPETTQVFKCPLGSIKWEMIQKAIKAN